MFPNGIAAHFFNAILLSVLTTRLCTLLHDWNIWKTIPLRADPSLMEA
jgi:hypothetical protein